MKTIFYGHSCVEIDFDGTKVLMDPFISYNSAAKEIDVNALNPDYIFLSHCHQDHVADMALIQKNSNATVVSIVEAAAWVRKQGVPDDKVVEFNFGGTLELTFGKVKMVYALHTSSTPEGDYAGVPVGYVFFVNGKSIYFAGDTALTLEMQLLQELNLDWAFLPIGGHYTMDVDDAVKASKLIKCSNIIGIHYDTFPPIAIDREKAQDKFEAAGLNLHLLEIGGTLDLIV